MKNLVLVLGLLAALVMPVKGFVVDVHHFEPCVIIQDGKPTGFDIELWEKVAEEAGIKDYKYREVKQFKNMFDGITSGEADVAVSGITITDEREMKMDFTHRYLEADIKVLTPIEKEMGIMVLLQSIFQKNVIKLLLLLLGYSAFVGLILWLIERKPNDDISKGAMGVFDCFELSLVTNSTVGYGNKVARTIAGRIVIIFAILSGLAIFGAYIGVVGSNVTFVRLESKINFVEDLKGKNVVTVESTHSDKVLTGMNLGANIIRAKVLDDAYALLKQKKAEAIAFDAPPLARFAKKHEGQYALANFSLQRQDFGFALPQGSPDRERINRALLKLSRTGVYDVLYKKWFGSN